MQQYTVTGMHCAACSASVEKAVKKVPGVTSCAVSLLMHLFDDAVGDVVSQVASAITGKEQ